jgi:hypothetical protein
MDVHGPEEDFESIPWESIGDSDRRPAWQPAAAGVAIGAALVFLLLRPGPDATVAAEAAAPSSSPPTSIGTTSSTSPAPSPSMLPEADLMAVEAPDLEAAAGTVAQRFLTDFFTVDEGGRSAAERWIDVPAGTEPGLGGAAVVEDVEVLDARRVAPDRVVVTAEVRRSLRSDPETVDLTSFEVEVAFGDAGARIVDLPRPVAGVEVPPEVLAAGVAAVEPLVADQVLAAEVHGDVWRLVIAARDRFGMVWPLAVTVDAEAVPDVPGDQEK